MKYKNLTFSCALILFIHVIAAQNGVGDFKSIISEKENEIKLSTEHALLSIEFCTPAIIRFRTSWNQEFLDNEPWMVSNYNWDAVKYRLVDSEGSISIITKALQVDIQKSPFAVRVFDRDGTLLSSDINIGSFKNDQMVGAVKQLQADEHFFGFGERMDFLDRRGKKVRLDVGRGIGRPHIIGAYNVLEANYSPVPFFMSTKGYGIFFHNAYPTTWDMGADDTSCYSFQAAGGELDYYFIYGPDFASILEGYTGITGRSPLLPKFALGLQVGTYSGGTWGHEEETSTDYVVGLAKKFRDSNIPLDVLHLDSTWRIFGENGGKGATSFEWRETFINPEKMFSDLYDLHLNMVGLHLRPRVDNGKELRLLDEAREKGYVYPEEDNPGEFVNYFDQKAVDWWFEKGVKRVADQGAMFLKTDEGSAFGRKANESDKTGPRGKGIKSLHNLFPIAYAKAAYEQFQEYTGLRGMNNTREGFAGIQRYPFIFAGDWPSEWQYFEPVITAGLNIGLSGVSNWAHCMGGFEHVADPELYIRWCQFGLLSPIAHLFGMEHPNYKEPWNYGEEAMRIFRKYDNMRYSLMPYLYSYMYENHRNGTPIMRALVMSNQDDENVYNITDQYMLGDYLMVCPVTEKGAQTRVVYLPKGVWTDYWTGKTFQGKKYYNVLCPIDQVPVFIKEGAVIPTQEVLQYIGEKEISGLTLDVYPNASGTFHIYNDDGRTLKYVDGQFNTTDIVSEVSENKIILTIHATKGAYKGNETNYLVNFHLLEQPSSVMVNGKAFGLHDDAYSKGILTIAPEETNQADIVIVINI